MTNHRSNEVIQSSDTGQGVRRSPTLTRDPAKTQELQSPVTQSERFPFAAEPVSCDTVLVSIDTIAADRELVG